MKKLVLLFTILSVTTLRSQVKIDSTQETGPEPMLYFTPIDEVNSSNFYAINSNQYFSSYPYIVWFDKNINILDTISGNDIGLPTANFSAPFKYANSQYYIYSDLANSTARKYSFHKIENGIFTDSIGLDLDTIIDGAPHTATEMDNGELRIIINSIVNGRTIGMLYLDSNFNGVRFHRLDFDTTPRRILEVNEINDSIWHLFSDGVEVYNPKQKQILFKQKFFGIIRRTYDLPGNEYMALGTVATRPYDSSSVFQSNQTALGFYIIDYNGRIQDTIKFSAYTDTMQGPQNLSFHYSTENGGTYYSNSVVYDTSNILLASQGSFSLSFVSPDREYFFVVKTDVSGNLKWKYIFGGIDALVALTGMSPTDDKGCIITGSIRRASGVRYGIIIKLGPDGTISNVELDAPETVINFYPNPVKDKLYYNYLPEASGNYTLEIIDMQGKPVQDVVLENAKGFIPVSLQSGFYLYHLKSDNGKVEQVGRLVVE